MNFLGPRCASHQAFQKHDEILAGVPRGRHAVHLSRFHIQRRIQRQRPVAKIFETVTFGASRRQRQHWIETIQRWNRGLLVHAKHRRRLRWIQVQANDIGGFFLEARMVGCPVTIQPARLQSRFAPTPAAPWTCSASASVPSCGRTSGWIRPLVSVAFGAQFWLAPQRWPRAAGCLCVAGRVRPGHLVGISVSIVIWSERWFEARS